MTTRQYKFTKNRTESLGQGAGPDFPGSAGGREQGKFRESETPHLTTVAVVDDSGLPIARTVEQILEETLLYQKAILLALSLASNGASFSTEDILNNVG